MRDHGLGLVFFAFEIRGQGLVKLHDAVLTVPALLVQGTKTRVQSGAIDVDLVAQLRTTGLEIGEHRLDVTSEKVQHHGLITCPQASFKTSDVLAGMERQRREQGEGTILMPELEDITG